ncbi:bifunctional 2-polyprenyl-6-hydroxyphenol methylase/3-demethylubiquinol 3-O-methyltransferase UbiG [Corynebacterium glyciniphilum]|uniref:class I SAM-dependent methyltransferase n=1 Tax=Corynebacterium glyciniphilum TaxID=1404244 RepID=UPI002651C250|nr:class I SAM-dependent methyltransferase [Corynebacterium glyciniphilum]MDN6707161.1 class I SAM-dependent methyltransferase [Corynebacterium glyciniphilum]
MSPIQPMSVPSVPSVPEPSPATGSTSTTWASVTGADPAHSQRYIARWEGFEHEGKDIDGEARLIDAMASRHARVLDAGSGTGRVAVSLAARGHLVSAVDIDPQLVEYARERYAGSGVEWHVGDLASSDDVPVGPFDIIVSAGNVLAFIPDAAHRQALGVLASRLAPGGRLVVGFGLSRGRSVEAFEQDVAAADLRTVQRFSSWELHPFNDGENASDFMVAVLQRSSVDGGAVDE